MPFPFLVLGPSLQFQMSLVCFLCSLSLEFVPISGTDSVADSCHGDFLNFFVFDQRGILRLEIVAEKSNSAPHLLYN